MARRLSPSWTQHSDGREHLILSLNAAYNVGVVSDDVPTLTWHTPFGRAAGRKTPYILLTKNMAPLKLLLT